MYVRVGDLESRPRDAHQFRRKQSGRGDADRPAKPACIRFGDYIRHVGMILIGRFHSLSDALADVDSSLGRLLNPRQPLWKGRTISLPLLLKQTSPLRPPALLHNPPLQTALQTLGSVQVLLPVSVSGPRWAWHFWPSLRGGCTVGEGLRDRCLSLVLTTLRTLRRWPAKKYQMSGTKIQKLYSQLAPNYPTILRQPRSCQPIRIKALINEHRCHNSQDCHGKRPTQTSIQILVDEDNGLLLSDKLGPQAGGGRRRKRDVGSSLVEPR